jgi:hypothetical protein
VVGALTRRLLRSAVIARWSSRWAGAAQHAGRHA